MSSRFVFYLVAGAWTAQPTQRLVGWAEDVCSCSCSCVCRAKDRNSCQLFMIDYKCVDVNELPSKSWQKTHPINDQDG